MHDSLFSSVFSLDVDYNGDILGEEQWRWLEQVLNETVKHSNDIKFNIIVSSIQVFSSNPLLRDGHTFQELDRGFWTL